MRTPYTRRLSDEIPLGVECALPRDPDTAPAKPARPSAKIDIWRKLALVLVALLVIAGLWRLGQGVFTHATHAKAGQDGWTRVALITGYPFDALRAGGPLSRVVFADALTQRG